MDDLIRLLSIFLIFCLILSIPIYFLWNYVVPPMFDIPRLTYRQAYCLTVLVKLLLAPIEYDD